MTAMSTNEPTDPVVLLHHHHHHHHGGAGISHQREGMMSNNSISNSSESATDSIGDESEVTTTSTTKRLHRSSSANSVTTSNTTNKTTTHGMAQYTPPRSSLAMDPSLTPIASIQQRPSMNKQRSSSTSNAMTPPPVPRSSSSSSGTPMSVCTPVRNSSTSTPSYSPSYSNMHGVKTITAVRRRPEDSKEIDTAITDQVDALFSPVAQFLHDHHQHPHSGGVTTTTTISLTTTTSSGEDHPEEEEQEEDTETLDYDDDDGSMDPPEAPNDDDDDHDKFNPWLFIASLPEYEKVVPFGHPETTLLPPIQPALMATPNIRSTPRSAGAGESMMSPPRRPLPTTMKRKTLVLDLDETLVHCKVEAVPDPDFCFNVLFNGQTYSVNVKCRPHLKSFLEAVSTKFEVVVFTASQKVYAEALLNILDPEGKLIHHRLYREACLSVEGNYLKDLNVLGRDLSQTVLVDNSPHAFGYQVDNGIPIESWWNDMGDKELRKLQRFLLKDILPASDVRPVVRQKFQSHALVADAAGMTL